MTQQVHMTALWVRKVKAPEKGRDIYKDTETKGLKLYVTSRAKKWYLRYKLKGANRAKEFCFGEYPAMGLQQARRKAMALMSEVQEGRDPQYERQKAVKKEETTPSVAEFAETYLELHARPNKKPKSFLEDKRQLEKYILPSIGSLKVMDVERAHLVAILDSLGKRAPVQANRTRALLSKFFNFAIDRGVIESSPASRLPRYAKEESRDRVMTEDEIAIFWQATEEVLSQSMRDIFRLLLLTAQRRSEVLSMRWDELDINRAMWTIPGERAKNGLTHTVPLSPTALEIIKARPRVTEYAFPGGKGRKHIASTGKAMTTLRRASGLDIRPHDLRRTCATYLTTLGCPEVVLKAILNHKDSGNITRIYDRNRYDDQKRHWLERWDWKLKGIVKGQKRTVIPFPAKQVA